MQSDKNYLETAGLKIMSAWLVFSFVVLFAPNVKAAAESACDPDYYKSLESRAWMEAQREIEQNQNLIVKPDSVLEYTCFDLFGAELAQHAIDMFSETTDWGEVLPATSMDDALSSLVGEAIHSYQETNFNHKSLGGRGIDKRQMPARISGGSYTCDQMNRIWQQSDETAKCYNFQTLEQDGFFTFKDYADGEVVRQLPEACNPDGRWSAQNEIALGEYLGGSDEQTPWKEDTQFEYLDVEASCDKSPTIETGLMVKMGQSQEFPEQVCLIPGCNYQKGSGCVQGSP